jgi:hypothetical protein
VIENNKIKSIGKFLIETVFLVIIVMGTTLYVRTQGYMQGMEDGVKKTCSRIHLRDGEELAKNVSIMYTWTILGNTFSSNRTVKLGE